MPQETICLDMGHNAISRGVDSGAQGCGLLEQDLTLDIGKRLKSLLQINGFTVIATREGDSVAGDYTTVTGSLQARCDISNDNNVNLFISLHTNAGGGTGVEIYVSQFGGNAEKCANAVLPYLVDAGQWANRGVKQANDYVLVHTDASAILIEHGFIDTESDASKLADPNFRQSLAVADCKGICDYFGVTYQDPTTTTSTSINQSTSSNTEKHLVMGNAEIAVDQAETYLHKINPNAPYYAQIYKEEGEKEGVRWDIAFCQSLKETNYFKFGGTALTEWNNFAGIGVTGVNYIPFECTETQFVDGVMQIKDSNGQDVGIKFSTPILGIKCQIQHLKAYSSIESLVGECIDPRFKYVQRNKAPYIEDFGNGIWAADTNNYGESIINIYNQIAKGVVNNVQGVVNKVKNLVIYIYPEDEGSAMNLARHLMCPVSFYPKQFTSDLLDCVENIYQIGGLAINSKVKLISGNDFDDSTVAYLKFVGKI